MWGDKAHKWVRRRLCSSTGHATWWCNTPLLRVQMKPGSLLTRGPGFYKIPSFNDVPIDFRISLLADAPNPAVRVYVCCARAPLVSCLCSLERLNLSSCATCPCCLFRLCTPPRPWVSRRSSWLPPCSSPSRMPSTPPAKKAVWKATSRWICQPPPSAFAWHARTRLWLAALAVQKPRRRTVCPAASKYRMRMPPCSGNAATGCGGVALARCRVCLTPNSRNVPSPHATHNTLSITDTRAVQLHHHSTCRHHRLCCFHAVTASTCRHHRRRCRLPWQARLQMWSCRGETMARWLRARRSPPAHRSRTTAGA